MSVINITVNQPASVTNLTAQVAVAGPSGAPGQTVLNGSGAPGAGKGRDGDFYIDTTTSTIYGPKTAGTWGGGTNLVGPAGAGSGDMLKSVYDPGSKAADSFSMGNMAETTTKKILTDTERSKLAGIEAGAEVTNATKVAAAGAFMKATDNLDAITDGTTYKKYSATEKTKLAGIATNADVTSATNVAAAGAAMKSDTATTGYGFVVNENDLVSNSATKVPTQKSVKAYVDTSIANSGSGDVVGPSNSAVNELAVYSDATGKVLKRATDLLYDTGSGGLIRNSGLTLSAGGLSPVTLQSGTAQLSVMQDNAPNEVQVTGGFQARINPRATQIAAATITPDVSGTDMYHYHILSVNLTINAPIGNPVTGNKLLFAFKDNGTSRSIAWNVIFTPIGVTIPTATVPNKWTYVGAVYNSATTKWHVIAVSQEA